MCSSNITCNAYVKKSIITSLEYDRGAKSKVELNMIIYYSAKMIEWQLGSDIEEIVLRKYIPLK